MGKIVRTEYQVVSGKPVVSIFERDGLKRNIKKDPTLRPYFYISENEVSSVWNPYLEKGTTYRALDGTTLRKLFTTLPEDVPKLREGFNRTWEADIVFQNRYLIDKVDSIESTVPRLMFLDIETSNKGRVPDSSTAEESIICITCYDNLTDCYSTFVWRSDIAPGQTNDLIDESLQEINFYKNEKDMLQAFIKYVYETEPDLISGWFSNDFDIPYLINRMLGTGLDPNGMSPLKQVYIRNDGEPIIRGIALIDLIDVYKHFTFNVEESYSLDYIAKKTVGKGKIGSSNNVNYLWRTNLDELIKYNSNDTHLCVEINKKRQLLEFLDEMRRICFCQYEDALTTSRIVDQYILKMFHNKIIFPTKKHNEREELVGALTERYCIGIKDNVIVFDLRSLYPSIIMSANLSTECFVDRKTDNCIEVNNHIIDMSKTGFLVEVIKSLFLERLKYKKLSSSAKVGSDEYKLYYNRQYVLKTLLNAIYGQTSYTNSRYFDFRIAETITYLGRQIVMWSKQYLESLGFEVLYVDTDSCFFTGNRELSISEIEGIRDKVNKSYDDFVVKMFGRYVKHSFETEFDKLYRKIFWGNAKKRYAGNVVYQDGQVVNTLHVMGFEIRRSDASQFSKNLQSGIFKMLLQDDKSKDDVLRYISNEISRIRTGNFMFSEVGIPKGIQKQIKDYAHPGSNVRGAKYAIEKLGLQLSNKPKLLYVSQMPKGLPETDVFCFDEDSQVPAGTQIDIDKMLDKLVKDKIDSIFEALGWSLKDLNDSWAGKKPKQGNQATLLDEEVLEKLTDKCKVKVKKKVKVVKKEKSKWKK